MILTQPTYIIAEVDDLTALWVRELRSKYAPHAVKWPIDITLVGSGGVGPIKKGQSLDEIILKSAGILAEKQLEEFTFSKVIRFPNTGIHYLEPPRFEFDPLHNKLKECGIEYEPNQFSYTPHCTICYSQEYSESVEKELQKFDIPKDAVSIKYFSVYSLDKTGFAKKLHDY